MPGSGSLEARSTFTEHTAQVPAYTRSTARLQEAVVDAVRVSRRAVDEVARAFTIGWWTVQRALSRAALAMAAPEGGVCGGSASTSTASAGSGSSATRTLARGGAWSRGWCPSSTWTPAA